MQLIKILNANYLIGICCDKGMNAGLWKHCLYEYDKKKLCLLFTFLTQGLLWWLRW